MLGKILNRCHIEIFFFLFFFFFKKIGFDFSCKLEETICMKSRILLYGKNKKNIVNLLSAEFAHIAVKTVPLQISRDFGSSVPLEIN